MALPANLSGNELVSLTGVTSYGAPSGQQELIPISQLLGLNNPLDPRLVTAPATVRHVTNRTCIFSSKSGSNTQSGWRCWQISYVPLSAIKVAFANWYVPSGGTGETSLGSDMTVRITVEYPHGTFTPILWNGSTSGVITDTTTGVSDLTVLKTSGGVPFTIPAFAKFRLCGDINMSGSGRVPSVNQNNFCDRANGDEYLVGASGYGHTQDDTILGSGSVSGILPQAVMGLSDRNVWVAIGDSIISGVNDNNCDPSGGRGLVGRALAKLGPNMNFGTVGEKASIYATSNALRTGLIATAGVNRGILELGVNDFYTSSRTTDQVLADRTTIRTLYNFPIFDTTLTPETTSSDVWQTASNQTATSAGTNTPSRCNFNDFLRGTTSWTVTGTLTNGSAVVSAITAAGLSTVGVTRGMTATSGTSGIPGSTTVSSVSIVNGTVTMSANFTGSTTPGATVTFAWPASSQTFPTNSAGLIDVAQVVETSTDIAFGQITNGTVWTPGYIGQIDGVHPNSRGYQAVESIVTQAVMSRTTNP